MLRAISTIRKLFTGSVLLTILLSSSFLKFVPKIPKPYVKALTQGDRGLGHGGSSLDTASAFTMDWAEGNASFYPWHSLALSFPKRQWAG